MVAKSQTFRQKRQKDKVIMDQRGKPVLSRSAASFQASQGCQLKHPGSEAVIHVIAPYKIPTEHSQMSYLSCYQVEQKNHPAEQSYPTEL